MLKRHREVYRGESANKQHKLTLCVCVLHEQHAGDPTAQCNMLDQKQTREQQSSEEEIWINFLFKVGKFTQNSCACSILKI